MLLTRSLERNYSAKITLMIQIHAEVDLKSYLH